MQDEAEEVPAGGTGRGRGTGGRQYINMLYQLLRLRQACNHPWLVRGPPGAPPGTLGGSSRGRGSTATAAEVAAVRKLAPDTQAALLQALQGCSSMCGVCGDVPEDPCVTRCCHLYCRQCLSTRLEGSGSDIGEGLGFNCLVCGGAVRPGDAFRGGAIEAAAAAAAGGGGLGDGSGAAGSGRGKGSRGKSPAAALEQSWKSSTKVDKVIDLLNEIRQRNQGAASAGAAAAAAAAAQAAARVVPLAARSKTDALLMARMRRSRSPAVPPAAAGGPGAASGTSGTSSAAVLPPDQRPEKVIVFSQWTSMLDLLEVPLKKAGFGFRRLDGTMTVAARERAIADFESCYEVMLLIVVSG